VLAVRTGHASIIVHKVDAVASLEKIGGKVLLGAHVQGDGQDFLLADFLLDLEEQLAKSAQRIAFRVQGAGFQGSEVGTCVNEKVKGLEDLRIWDFWLILTPG
jgi:hypothetical protein